MSGDERDHAPHGVYALAGNGLLAAYVLAIVYASLNPFSGWRLPEAFLLFTWPKYWSLFDIVLNVLAYIPLGTMLATVMLRVPQLAAATHRITVRALLLGGALSLAMELLQSLLPQRVSSPVDLATNVAGAFIGAAAMVSQSGRAARTAFLAWRERSFAAHGAGAWGAVLLGAWLVTQSNPLIPFFEAHQFVNPFELAVARDAYDAVVLFPQMLGVALNAAGFALFVSLVLHPRRNPVSTALAVLALGFAIKVAAAALMLRAPALAEWIAPAPVIGLATGLALFALLSRLTLRWRAFFATLLIFAGGLLAQLTSVEGAFDQTVRLLNWPYGHVATFAGLTRWMHDSWPPVACVFAAWVFVRRP
ncbi:MAG TPA: VanZ family protein [Usitatibacteraceae bacterium]|nr:VanZ family protein [Usitatibacteraceae bacterium]